MAGLTGKTIAATYHSILKVSTSDNQNVDTTLRDIVDGEDTASCLKLATDKATFTLGTDAGDDFKIYNGTTNIITVEGDNGTVTLDKDFSGTTTATTNGLVIDFDATGITASGQTATNIGLDLDLNSDSPTMVGTVNNTGIDVLLTAATSGTQKNIGMNIAVTGADTNYALLTSGGNVGIGVSDPDTTLEVFSTSAQLKLSYDANSFATFEVDASDDVTIKTAASGGFRFQATTDTTDYFQILDADAGTPIFNVDSTNERVGIGVAAPATALEVNGSTTGFLDLLTLENTNTGDGSVSLLFQSNRGSVPHEARINVDPNADSAGSEMQFYTDNTSGSLTLRMVLDKAGNVGIGTASPTNLLHVVQTATSGQALHVSRDLILGSTDAPMVEFHNDHAGDDQQTFYIKHDPVDSVAMGIDYTAGSVDAADCIVKLAFSAAADATNADFIQFWDTAEIGKIYAENGTTVLHNMTSDYRLKENVESITGGLDRIVALRPVTYNYIGRGGSLQGFIAHEAQEAGCGVMVRGEKDGMKIDRDTGEEVIDPQSIALQQLIPQMVSAIKELSAKVEALENA